ncbi:MAG: hypothetical protein ACT4PX_10980 [Actinomycetota bacterium]
MVTRRVVGALLVLGGAAGAFVPASPGSAQVGGTVPAGARAEGLRIVGHNDLGGRGLNGDVAVVGTTAVVAAGYLPSGTALPANAKMVSINTFPPCANPPVNVVDLSDPAHPRVTATIPVPTGQLVREVDALHVSTPAFTGDLAALAFATCAPNEEAAANGISANGSFAHRGVALFDVSDASRPREVGRYMADADNWDPAAPPCGRPPAGFETNCAKDVYAVDLKRIRDGRVIMAVSRVDGADNVVPSSDLRLVDVTDPAKPVQLGTWPPLTDVPARLSPNGCFPRSGTRSMEFSADGTEVLVPYLDGGLFTLDARDLRNLKEKGRYGYPKDWNVEGNAAYVTEATVGAKRLALLAEEDWWWPSSAFRIDSPPSLAGTHLGCSDLYTLIDPEFDAQIHRKPGAQVAGELAYIGRGCPARSGTPADPFLMSPAGKIAFTDNAANPVTQPGLSPSSPGCSFASRTKWTEINGATANILRTAGGSGGHTESIAGFPGPGWPVKPRETSGAEISPLSIPGFQIKGPIGDAIRSTMCPGLDAQAKCTGGQPVTGALVDLPGEWGGLRILDVTNPAAPADVGMYRSPGARVFPPPDHRGIYSVHHAVVDGTRVYGAWNSDGLRVLDLKGGLPVEIGSFVPPDTVDPTRTVPPKAFVLGVDHTARHIVVSDMSSGLWVLEKPSPTAGGGYWLAGADGGVFALGDAAFHGSAGALRLRQPIVGIAATPSGRGYWLVAADGGVFAFGDAVYRGSMGGGALNARIVGMAATPTGNGYWLAAADGGVFAFGDARFSGSMASTRLKAPIAGIAATPGGRGYRLVAADGGVFAFGDAAFYGSAGALTLRAPVVGIRPTTSGRGYHLVAQDGGIFAYGDAVFSGSTAGQRLAAPIVGMDDLPGAPGYWTVGSDGGVYAFGAPFLGSLGGNRLNAPVVGLATVPR